MRRTITALVLTAGALSAACTTTIGGHANPVEGSASGGSSASADASTGRQSVAAVCERTAKPDACTEWKQTTPVTGQQLLTKVRDEPETAAQMVCSALSEQALDTYLGPGHYRFVEGGSSCAMWSADDQLAIRVGINAVYPLSEYLRRFKSDARLAPQVSELTIGGAPVMKAGLPHEADGKGTDAEDLTVGVAGEATKPGVMQVQVLLRQPRGKPDSTPVDRARLDMRDAVVGDLLKALFPQR